VRKKAMRRGRQKKRAEATIRWVKKQSTPIAVPGGPWVALGGPVSGGCESSSAEEGVCVLLLMSVLPPIGGLRGVLCSD